MNVIQAIESRKSVRGYSGRIVEPEKMEGIIRAANQAPVFGEFHITVIESKKMLKNISDTTISMMKNSGDDFSVKRASTPGYTPVYGAPVMIVLSAQNGNDGYGFNVANVSLAAENMLLTATDSGLASCFVMAPMMAFSNPDMLKSAGIPDSFVPLCGVLVGYSEDSEPHTPRAEKENVNYCR